MYMFPPTGENATLTGTFMHIDEAIELTVIVQEQWSRYTMLAKQLELSWLDSAPTDSVASVR